MGEKSYYIDKLNELGSRPVKENRAESDAIEREDRARSDTREELAAKYGLDRKMQVSLARLHVLAMLSDERKIYTTKIYAYYHKILLELEKRHGIPFKYLKYLFTEDLAVAGHPFRRREIVKVAAERIRNGFVAEYSNGRYRIMDREEADLFVKEVEGMASSEELKGKVASTGATKPSRRPGEVLFLRQ